MTTVYRSVRTAPHLWKRIYQHPASAIDAGFRGMSTSGQIQSKKLDGKIAIVTGGVGAVGIIASKLFAAHGAQVVLADISDDEIGHRKASEIGSNAHYRRCDVAKEEDVASTVDFVVEKFGKLDIMFNNAGVVTKNETMEDIDLEDYDRSHAINVRGVIAGIKHAARVMIPTSQGVILNTASIAAGVVSSAFPLAYNISKHNLPGLTRIAAHHLGKYGIRVNAISPNGILNPLAIAYLQASGVNVSFEEAEQTFIDHSALFGKRATEDDIAKGALFLCSDDSGYISGQNLVVDGGWSSSKDLNVARDLLEKGKPKELHGTG